MMTIGEVIDALERAKPDATVVFSFCGVAPSTVHSWRGIYAEAALGFEYEERGQQAPTVADLLVELRTAIEGRTFHGWKGGEYKYDRSTPLHIDNSGCWTSTELFRIQASDYQVILHTAKEDH